MKRRALYFAIALSLVMTAAPVGAQRSGVQPPTFAQRPPNPDSTITDAAGRVHNVMPMRQMTPAQRKAAAKRLKATRAAREAQKKHNANAPTPQPEVQK